MDGESQIARVHAFIVVDDDGTEGIAGFLFPGSTIHTPLVSGDRPGAVKGVEQMADIVAEASGKTVKHYVFSERTHVRDHTPLGQIDP